MVSRGLTVEPGKWSTITLSTLHTLLLSQLGLTDLSASLECRIRRATVWLFGDVKTLVNPDMGAVFYPLYNIQSGSGFLHSIEDVGTAVRPAKASFTWPRSHYESVLLLNGRGFVDHNILAVDSSSEKLPVAYHIEVLWRSTATDLVPSVGVRNPPPLALDV